LNSTCQSDDNNRNHGWWRLFARAVAVWAAELGAVIEVVNRFGSFFSGSILEVFILAIVFRSIDPRRPQAGVEARV